MQKSAETLVDEGIRNVLQVKLIDSEITGATPIPTPLPSLTKEWLESNVELQFTRESIDATLLARLGLESNSHVDSKPLFVYLVDCWKRANNVLLKTPKDDARRPAMQQIKQLAVSYAGLVSNPDTCEVFPQPPAVLSSPAAYISTLLPDNLPKEFIEDFIKRFSDDGLAIWFEPIFKRLMKKFSEAASLVTVSFSGPPKDWNTPLRSIMYLASFKPIAQLIHTFGNFDPPGDMQPRTMAILTFLGPIFEKNSVFKDSDPEVAKSLFASTTSLDRAIQDAQEEALWERGYIGRNPSDVISTQKSLQASFDVYLAQVHGLIDVLFKASPESRKATLGYFTTAVLRNLDREKLQVQWETVSTHGFLWSMASVALRFALPLYGNGNFPKMAMIENGSHYFIHGRWRPAWKEWTKMLDSQEEAEAYADAIPTTDHSFVTEIFFVTAALMHVGPLATLRHYSNIVRSLHDARPQFHTMLSRRDSGQLASQGPFAQQMMNMQVQRASNDLDNLITERLCMETAAFEEKSLQDQANFYHLMMAFVYKTAGITSNFSGIVRGDTVMEPWETPNPDWRSTVEWMVEDVIEFYSFLMKHNMPLMQQMSKDEIVTFCIVMLLNSNYIRNPYLKSKFVETLYLFTVPLYRSRPDNLSDVLLSNPTAKRWLVHVLTRWYVDVESTGTHTAFYDKFNARYQISQILKTIWMDPQHHQTMVNLAQDHEFFVRFVNLLINDTTYLLDESISKLQEIKTIELEMKRPDWGSKTDQERSERETLLAQDERQASSFMSLANETVHMLNYLTSESALIGPFMAPEIVDRLAAMMDYNLVALVGPRCSELAVSNPEKYRFRPKVLLLELVEIYLHLMQREEFIKGVVKDQRSYNKTHFQRAGGILIRSHLKSQEELNPLLTFVDLVEQHMGQVNREEEELGDVPEEFEDPLMATLMVDPVLLPSSRKIVDRSTIKQHLLSDAHDPFNRQPLNMEDVVPDTDLKMRIEAWKRSRLS
jgi:ubiquitin conjugation factor E4 B